jgi:hypothetical protein
VRVRPRCAAVCNEPPKDQVELAEIDGATGYQLPPVIGHAISLPSMRHTLLRNNDLVFPSHDSPLALSRRTLLP